METAQRELTFLLANPERRLLRAIAERLPGAANSDHLTALGILGAAAAGVCAALSSRSPLWLHAASLGLVINWFGDSLDGTLARVRQVERPRYGYYLDHAVDVFTTFMIGAGMGLSPYLGIAPALALVAGYLALSINIYLESQVFGVFKLSYGRLGPTEVRLLLIGANTALALGTGTWWTASQVRPVANIVALVLTAAMGGLLLWRVGKNVAVLGRLEPLRLVEPRAKPQRAA